MATLGTLCLVALGLLLSVLHAAAVELTFELQERDTQCFYERVKKGEKAMVEFQVVTGGHYDVDCTIQSPHGAKVYAVTKKDYDQHEWTADVDGDYKVCFSNEFSTVSHKIVYMDFVVGDEPSLLPTSHHSAMTMMESSAQAVHDTLSTVVDYQTHYRLRESQGRKFAEELNDRVMYWSLGQTAFMLLVGLGQVIILRSFFSDRK